MCCAASLTAPAAEAPSRRPTLAASSPAAWRLVSVASLLPSSWLSSPTDRCSSCSAMCALPWRLCLYCCSASALQRPEVAASLSRSSSLSCVVVAGAVEVVAGPILQSHVPRHAVAAASRGSASSAAAPRYRLLPGLSRGLWSCPWGNYRRRLQHRRRSRQSRSPPMVASAFPPACFRPWLRVRPAARDSAPLRKWSCSALWLVAQSSSSRISSCCRR